MNYPTPLHKTVENRPLSINRIHSIDFARGVVMIIMALDHVRDLLHTTSLTQSPTDLNTTTPLLFFTRWITYLCAPTFVFLSGTSAYLSFLRSGDVDKTRSFLIKRGIWLIVLEFTLVNFALWFDIRFRILMLQVIAAIGFGLILIGLLLNAKPKILATVALAIIGCHNLLPAAPPTQDSFIGILWVLLFQQRLIPVAPDFVFLVAYPLIPWFGIMLLGFAFGGWFLHENSRMMFRNIAFAALALFMVFRFVNVYGDPQPWAEQKSPVFSLLSFLNVTKYPPSLQYDLLFLGMMFLLLAIAEKLPPKLLQFFSVYGKVPLFYYILHLYFIRLAVFLMVFAQGFSWNDLSFAPFQFGRPASGSGINLALVYFVWIIIVALLYPLCKWYARYKFSNKEMWWLRYL